MQKKTEKQVMNIGAFSNVILFATGLYIYISEKMMLRLIMCAMSLITFLTYAIGGVISSASSKKTKAFPDGRYYLEPLYSILKSLFFLTLMAVSLLQTGANTRNYILNGTGVPMNIDALMIFNIVNLVVGLGVYILAKVRNKKMGNISTILDNISATNYLAVIQSFFMIIMLEGIKYLNRAGKLLFLSYTGEFIIVVMMCALSVKVQTDVIVSAFTELRHGTTDSDEIKENVSKAISECIDSDNYTCQIVKTGMMIFVNVILNEGITANEFETFRNARQNILSELQTKYSNISLSISI